MKKTSSSILAAVLACVLAIFLPGCFGKVAEDTSYMQVAEEAAVDADMAVMDAGAGWYFDDFSTEEYSQIKEAGFIATATQPLSTFSSDVDTASYCLLRRMLTSGASGQEIPSGAVRIEEMLNYFSYNYHTPTGNDLFGTTVALGDCPWNPDTKLLIIGFATAPESQRSAGRNLVFLIDSSGSMDEPDKLPLLQDTFAVLTEDLKPEDRISIVTYSGAERVVLNGEAGSEKSAIMRAIRSINAEGSTNGHAGLEMAYQLAQENYIEGGTNRIIMASDGDLNVGMTSESDLYDYVSEKRNTGIYLSVLGFGSGNYKDNKMETLADNGNGSYHYIDCEEEALRVFSHNLSANLEPLAGDVKLQVEFNPSQVKGYRLIGYENRAMEDAAFEDDGADAGDIGPNAQFTVAYEIVTADSEMSMPGAQLKYGADEVAETDSLEWLTCTMRYKPITGGNAEQQLVVSGADLVQDPGMDWAFAASVIEFGMVLRGSDYVGTATYDTAIELAEPAAGNDGLRQEYIQLVRMAAEGDLVIAPEEMEEYDRFYSFEE